MQSPASPPPPRSEAALYRYRFANAEFDEAQGLLRVDGRVVEMEPRPLAVLLELLRRPGEVLSRDELLQAVWEGRPTVDHVLGNAIGKLRKALGEAGATAIATLPRLGYRLDGPVERQVARLHTAVPPPELAAGQPVPGREAYVLEHALGEPPRPDVWLARHAKLGEKRVFKFAFDGERLAALRREYTLYRVLRAALGEREDLVRVQDSRLSQPPFYIECEFAGSDLLAWARSGALASCGRAERLALCLQVAGVVADAHEAGVLHKDIKPSNVLVAGQPGAWRARLADFGSGRLMDPQRLQALGVTALGLELTRGVTGDSHSGTVLYLAPELLAGQPPTTRSDLYALGLLLYQVLAGDLTRPISPGWEHDLADDLLCDDIRAATHAQATERLASVAEWAGRLQRLEERRAQREQERAAQAAAAAALARLQRQQAARPWLGALLTALVLGLAGTLWQWRQAVAQQRAAELAVRQADAMLGFLQQDVLRAGDPLAGAAQVPLTVREALVSAAASVAPRFAGLVGLEGRVRGELAQVLHSHGELAAALSQWALAVPALATALGPAHPDALAARYAQSMTLGRAGRVAEAREAVQAADTLAAGPSAAASSLAGSATSPAAAARLRVQQRLAHGSLLISEYRVVEAVAELEQAHGAAKALAPPDTALLDRSYGDLAAAYEHASRAGEAADLVRAWLATMDARGNAAPGMRLLAESRLAQALVYAERFAPARALLDEVLPRLARHLGPAALPVVQLRHVDCEWFGLQEQRAQALDCMRALHTDIRDAPGVPARIVALLQGNIGLTAAILDRWPEADAALTPALERLRTLDGGRPIRAMMLYQALQAKLALGELDAALRLRADTDLDPQLAHNADPSRPWAIRLRVLDGLLAQRQGRHGPALAHLDRAIAEYDALAARSGDSLQDERLYLQAKAQRARLAGRAVAAAGA